MASKDSQRGGTFMGFVAGLVVGLGLALVVAVYVTKVPVPFMSREAGSAPTPDSAEVQKNKDWDPNAALYGKNPAKPASSTEQVISPPATKEKAVAPVAAASDPLGDLARERALAKDGASKDAAAKDAGGVDPFVYFVQVGAFRTAEDAEAQRAKLSLTGVETKVTEREQSGHTVFRVRTGPYEKREAADAAKSKLDSLGLETALVRVQR
jgi:cell division protein FtsN